MTHKLNPRVDAAEHARYNTKELAYIEALREKGLLLEMDNVAVDADQLVMRSFRCNIGYCLKCGTKGGVETYKGSCCTDLVVDITAAERDKLAELGRRAMDNPEFKKGDALKVPAALMARNGFTKMNPGHEIAIRKTPGRKCVLAWIDESGAFRCSINSLVSRLGLSLPEYKPGPCYLFPLHYGEYARGKFILTLLSEETRHWAGHHKDVTKLACLSEPEAEAPPAYQSLRGEIIHCFGEKFYGELDALAAPLLKRRREKGAK